MTFFNSKKFIIIISLIIIIGVSLSFQQNNPSGWKGGGYEEPFSGYISLPPSEKDIQSVTDVTNASYDESMIALIESDNDIMKAIDYITNENTS